MRTAEETMTKWNEYTNAWEQAISCIINVDVKERGCGTWCRREPNTHTLNWNFEILQRCFFSMYFYFHIYEIRMWKWAFLEEKNHRQVDTTDAQIRWIDNFLTRNRKLVTIWDTSFGVLLCRCRCRARVLNVADFGSPSVDQNWYCRVTGERFPDEFVAFSVRSFWCNRCSISVVLQFVGRAWVLMLWWRNV